jgi:pumilio RNA-binding family
MLISQLVAKIDVLVDHEYGNFVIQQIIFLKDVESNVQIVKYIKDNFLSLAKRKFSSNVIDKVINTNLSVSCLMMMLSIIARRMS